jgi:hypothetical protein
MTKPPKQNKKPDSTKTDQKKKPVNIPLHVIPSDEGTVDDEMNELFDEDKVKHKHGTAEPERD